MRPPSIGESFGWNFQNSTIPILFGVDRMVAAREAGQARLYGRCGPSSAMAGGCSRGGGTSTRQAVPAPVVASTCSRAASAAPARPGHGVRIALVIQAGLAQDGRGRQQADVVAIGFQALEIPRLVLGYPVVPSAGKQQLPVEHPSQSGAVLLADIPAADDKLELLVQAACALQLADGRLGLVELHVRRPVRQCMRGLCSACMAQTASVRVCLRALTGGRRRWCRLEKKETTDIVKPVARRPERYNVPGSGFLRFQISNTP